MYLPIDSFFVIDPKGLLHCFGEVAKKVRNKFNRIAHVTIVIKVLANGYNHRI